MTEGSTIVYHFDVESHSLPLRQFIDTANATQSIIDNFNEEMFDNKVRYELRVSAPEAGGLIELIQVVLFVGGPIWAFLLTDIGRAYVKGLTGHEPAYWAENLGEKSKSILPTTDQEKSIPSELEIPAPDSDKEFEAMILVELIRKFLETHTDQLEKIGFNKRKFRKAFAAKNRVFEACVENPEVKAIGFERSHEFPLKRADFPNCIAKLPDEEKIEDDEDPLWSVDIVDVLANSPNWERDGRKWQGKTDKHKDIAFIIEDEGFWHHVKIKDIKPDFGDSIKVQWAYPETNAKPSHVRVLRVLSFNGRKISDPMTEQELRLALEDISVQEPESPNLFNHDNGWTSSASPDDNQQEQHKVKLTDGT